jgi:hypothetical protein
LKARAEIIEIQSIQDFICRRSSFSERSTRFVWCLLKHTTSLEEGLPRVRDLTQSVREDEVGRAVCGTLVLPATFLLAAARTEPLDAPVRVRTVVNSVCEVHRLSSIHFTTKCRAIMITVLMYI